MKHIHACLVKISSFIFSQQTKNSPVYLLKLAIIRNFGLIRDSTAKFLKSFGKNLWFLLAQINEISFFPKRSKNLLVKSWINPKLPVITNFKTYTGEFLFAKRRRMRIFLPNRYVNASYEWPNLEQFMGKCCSSVSSLDRLFELRHLFQWLPSNNTKQTKIDKKSHAIQLISEKNCSLPVLWALFGVEKGLTNDLLYKCPASNNIIMHLKLKFSCKRKLHDTWAL